MNGSNFSLSNQYKFISLKYASIKFKLDGDMKESYALCMHWKYRITATAHKWWLHSNYILVEAGCSVWRDICVGFWYLYLYVTISITWTTTHTLTIILITPTTSPVQQYQQDRKEFLKTVLVYVIIWFYFNFLK